MHQQILAMGLTFAEEKKKCQFPLDSVTFTEEILNGKLHVLKSIEVYSLQV